jgi:hypothetical protein
MTPAEAYDIVKLANQEKKQRRRKTIDQKNAEFLAISIQFYNWLSIPLICVILLSYLISNEGMVELKTVLFLLLTVFFGFASNALGEGRVALWPTLTNIITIGLGTVLSASQPFLLIIPGQTIFFLILSIMIALQCKF